MHPPSAVLPALSLLLLAQLTNAFPNRLPLTPHYSLSAPFATHTLSTTCLHPGTTNLLPPPQTLTCPCTLRFVYTRPFASQTAIASNPIDFLVIPSHDTTHHHNDNFHPQYSRLSTLPTLPHITKPLHYDSGYLTIPTNISISLSIRTTNPTPDCSTTVLLTLQRQIPQCPIVLPTDTSRSTQTKPQDAPTPVPPSPRIVGGNIPNPSLQSHMAAFVIGGSFVCSGSIISPRWVITAAHCGINRAFEVSLSSSSISDGTSRGVSRVLIHPQYDNNRQDSPYDIALVQLSSDAPQGTNFIRVNNNNTVPKPGAFSRAFGYGQIQEKQSGVPRLRQVDVPIVPMTRCKQKYSSGNGLLASRLADDLQLCAGRVEGGCDACQGDSGGPLAVFDSQRNLVQIGVVSFGIGCARPDFPGVYTRLSHFQDWMLSVGAVFTRSTDGRTVFAEGSAAAMETGFSIAGLNQWQSIAVLSAGAVAGLAVIVMLVYPLAKDHSRRRRRRDQAQDISSDDEPSISYDGAALGPGGSLGPRPQPLAAPYSPVYPQAISSAMDPYADYYYEGQPQTTVPRPNSQRPYSQPTPIPPYSDPQMPAPVYGSRSFEYGNPSLMPPTPESPRSGFGEFPVYEPENVGDDAVPSAPLPTTLYPPNSDANLTHR